MKIKVILAVNDNYDGKYFFCLGAAKSEDKAEIRKIISMSNADHIWTEEINIKE